MERQTLLLGLERMKADLLFILTGCEQAEKDFNYEQQRAHYVKAIFGSLERADELTEYGKQNKLFSEYMFPNNPNKIRKRRFLILILADCVLLNQMYRAESYSVATDEMKMREACLSYCNFVDHETESVFSREVGYLHSRYIKNFTPADYDEFRAMMKKFNEPFLVVLESVKACLLSKQGVSDRHSTAGLNRIKLDLLFILVGSVQVEKNFTYDQQRNYYVKEIFGNLERADELAEYGKQNKLFSDYMFPNNPDRIRNRKFLAEAFAECVLFNQMYLADSYEAALDKTAIQQNCFEFRKALDAEMDGVFTREINRRYEQYVQYLTADDYSTFKALMHKFERNFKAIFASLMNCVLNKKPSSSAEKVDVFSTLCKKLGVAQSDRVLFKLKLDALAEIQLGNNEYVEYFDSLMHGWEERFPEYKYCDEVEDYVRQVKYVCTIAFGNKLPLIRSELRFFDLLASVNVKLALSNGAENLDQLKKMLLQKTEKFSHDGLKNAFQQSVKNSIEYYSLDRDGNYSADIKKELVPYRAALLYVDEILIEEIGRREKSSAPSGQAIAQPHNETESEIAKYEKKYDMLLSQKDAEIYELKRELEYYENINAQDFRSDFSRYDEALTKLFQRMCERKYGAPLNELYLKSLEEDIKLEEIKTIIKNFLFIFNSMGINPYEIKNVGKTVQFDSDDANVVYSVNEKEIVEGINKGRLKYPGWKYNGKEMVLPLIVMESEGDS